MFFNFDEILLYFVLYPGIDGYLELTDPRTCAHVVAGLGGRRYVTPLELSSGSGRQH